MPDRKGYGWRSDVGLICAISLVPAIGLSVLPREDLPTDDGIVAIHTVTYSTPIMAPLFDGASSSGAHAILDSQGIPASDIWRE